MENCYLHTDHVAVEHCEQCGRPLCGLCLWYTESGHRYCKDHAQQAAKMGQKIISPDTYAEAISTDMLQRSAKDGPAIHDIPYKGNSYDLYGAIAAGLGIVTLLSCGGGVYCFPLVALVLGVMAYQNSHLAIDPKRTKNMAIVGMAFSGLLFLGLVSIFGLYFFGIMAAVMSSP